MTIDAGPELVTLRLAAQPGATGGPSVAFISPLAGNGLFLGSLDGGADSMGKVSALPTVPIPHDDDQLDPERILHALPEQERDNFLGQYREALDRAHDPAGWKDLRRVLRLWSWMTIAANSPGHYEAREQARAGTGEGMLLEDYIRLRRGA